ncbi:putative lipopolysaccharide biosynthesis protein, partial [Helicobacter pylori]
LIFIKNNIKTKNRTFSSLVFFLDKIALKKGV